MDLLPPVKDAIDLTVEQKPDIILMDINIKGPIDGVETAEKIKEMIDIPIIFLTAFTDSNTLAKSKNYRTLRIYS